LKVNYSSTHKLLMVGRGRGRGNAVSFNIEQLGLVEVKQVQFLLLNLLHYSPL
jgi:hypothetical protein